MEAIHLVNEYDVSGSEELNEVILNSYSPKLLQQFYIQSESECQCLSGNEFVANSVVNHVSKDILCMADGGRCTNRFLSPEYNGTVIVQDTNVCHCNCVVEKKYSVTADCFATESHLKEAENSSSDENLRIKEIKNTSTDCDQDDLNFRENKIVHCRIVENACENFVFEANSSIDYSCLELSKVPESLFSMPLITQLCLDYNDLTELPDHLFESLSCLQFLSLKANNLSHLPDNISHLNDLKELDIAQNCLQTLPISIGKLCQLEMIDFMQNKIVTLPLEIGHLLKLLRISGSGNLLRGVPQTFGRLSELQTIDFSNNQLMVIPNSFGFLINLKSLNLSSNGLETLPDSVSCLIGLESLDVSNNLLSHLPDSLKCLHRLKRLHAANNRLTALPPWVDFLPILEELRLGNNELVGCPLSESFAIGCPKMRVLTIGRNFIRSLPSNIVDLMNLEWVDLGNEKEKTEEENSGRPSKCFNWIWQLPLCFGELQSLTHLNCYGVQLEQLPDDFGHLKNLERLNLGCNYLHDLPESFCHMTSLRYLVLSLNNLEILPSDFGCLSNLEELRLDRNNLAELPLSFCNLTRLRYLDLFSNNLTDLPDFFQGFTDLNFLNLDENCFSEETAHLKLSGSREIIVKSRIVSHPDQEDKISEKEWCEIILEEVLLESEQIAPVNTAFEQKEEEEEDWDKEIAKVNSKCNGADGLLQPVCVSSDSGQDLIFTFVPSISHVESRRRFNGSDFSFQKTSVTEQFEDAEDD